VALVQEARIGVIVELGLENPNISNFCKSSEGLIPKVTQWSLAFLESLEQDGCLRFPLKLRSVRPP